MQGTKASLNPSLCTVAISKRAHFGKPNHTESIARDCFHDLHKTLGTISN